MRFCTHEAILEHVRIARIWLLEEAYDLAHLALAVSIPLANGKFQFPGARTRRFDGKLRSDSG